MGIQRFGVSCCFVPEGRESKEGVEEIEKEKGERECCQLALEKNKPICLKLTCCLNKLVTG